MEIIMKRLFTAGLLTIALISSLSAMNPPHPITFKFAHSDPITLTEDQMVAAMKCKQIEKWNKIALENNCLDMTTPHFITAEAVNALLDYMNTESAEQKQQRFD